MYKLLRGGIEVIIEFTLPSAGIWDVTYIICADVGAVGEVFLITAIDAVPNSTLAVNKGTTTGRIFITTTTQTTYRLLCGSFESVVDFEVLSDVNGGNTLVSWIKVG